MWWRGSSLSRGRPKTVGRDARMLRTTRATILILLLGLAVITSVVSAAETQPLEREAGKSFPDIALQAPPVNTSPGLEYAASTRMFQGIPSIECTTKGHLWAVWYGAGAGEGPLYHVVLVTSGDDGKS